MRKTQYPAKERHRGVYALAIYVVKLYWDHYHTWSVLEEEAMIVRHARSVTQAGYRFILYAFFICRSGSRARKVDSKHGIPLNLPMRAIVLNSLKGGYMGDYIGNY